MKNPFPGPLPYKAADRDLFFGRVDLARKLQATILANRCVTVYGPSGAGKSSLVQAAVLPALVERHDVRPVRVDAWPEGEEPTRWLASAMHTALDLGEIPPDAVAKDVLIRAVRGAVRVSSRILVLYLDQLEQLLFSNRTVEETGPFFDCLEELVEMPFRSVRVVLSLREDYLGRFRDRLRDMRRIADNGFRVGPLDVAALTEAVVLSAAAGDPPQTWSVEEMRGLMLQVRVPGQTATDEAEAQAAYAQIICRTLFHERAQGKSLDVKEAEPILRGYIESALAELGPLRAQAQQLLEDQLVGADGSRTLRTEKELERVATQSDLDTILKRLQTAAVLRAAQHQDTRYFEIGHDWLARWVYERRVERERIAEQKRIAAIQEEQLAQSRAQHIRLRRIAAGLVATTAIIAAAAVMALIARSKEADARREAEKAKQDAEAAEQRATRERDDANDLRVMAGVAALQAQGHSAAAVNLLTLVNKPEDRKNWVTLANEALDKNALFATLRGHRRGLTTAVFSPSGKRVLTASTDGTARIFDADGTGEPVVLQGHEAPITFAAFWAKDDSKTTAKDPHPTDLGFGPNEDSEPLRVLTTSADGTARVWTVRGSDVKSMVLPGKTSEVSFGAWSPDGTRVVVTSFQTQTTTPGEPEKATFVTRMHATSDGSLLGEHTEHKGRIHGAAFLDDTHVVTVSDDGSARVWDGTTKGRIVSLAGHSASVLFVTVNRTVGLVVTTSADGKVRVFKVKKQGNGAVEPYATLEGHTREVVHAAISDDGKFVATASDDKTARVWNIENPPKKGDGVVFRGHGGPVTFVAFRGSDARYLATASTDSVGRVFRRDLPNDPFILSGHSAPLSSIMWHPSGNRLVTAASDGSPNAPADHSAKIWRLDLLPTLMRTLEKRSEEANTQPSRTTFRIASFGHHWEVRDSVPPAEPFAAAYADATVALYRNPRDEHPLVFGAPPEETWDFISAMAPDSEGKRIAVAVVGVASKGARSDSTETKSVLYIFQEGDREKPIQRWNVAAAIRHIDWSKAGDRLVAALEDGTAVMFRIGDTAAPVVFRGHTGRVTSAAFNADQQRIVTTSMDRTALVFDVKGEGKPIQRYEHPDAVYSATFESKGQRLVTACADGKLRIFDSDRADAPVELDGKTGPLHRVAWSADGTRIAATTSARAILVWSPITWPLRNAISPIFLGEPTTSPSISALTFVGSTGGSNDSSLYAAGWDQIYSWQLDIKKLQADLRDNNRECLSVQDRIVYLNESLGSAQRAFQTCEQGYHRVRPAQLAPPRPNDAALVVATLLVLPWEADVEVDGIPYRRRDGLVELSGKLAEKKKVRGFHKGESIDVEVTIGSGEAKPFKIDLDALVAQKKLLSQPRGNPLTPPGL
ncbi:MAG TPA: hypothetical protein PK156_12180 [Polyangium sp.]|nr:hypothetical protein [Polyangium sp.]